MQIQWRVDLRVSALAAAHELFLGRRLVDEALQAALALPVQRLQLRLSAIPIPPAWLWRHFIPLAADVGDHRELARLSLIKGYGRAGPAECEGLTQSLWEIEHAFTQACQAAAPGRAPLEDLRLREKPLRELFEARGPGLLALCGSISEPELIAGAATVYCVHPVLGGAGRAHLEYNAVTMEGVLADPHPRLPEVVRLGWLLAQLQQDVPIYSESIHRDRLPAIAALAMLPVVLAAAEQVELARCNHETVTEALDAWRIATPESWKSDRAGPLWAWWESYRAARPAWPVALAALASLTAA